jgi:predicted CopG family antitoxin
MDNSFNDMNDRITITINRDVYAQLKNKGSFGETYNELILRLIKIADSISGGNK